MISECDLDGNEISSVPHGRRDVARSLPTPLPSPSTIMSPSILVYGSTVYPQSTPRRLDFIESATTADDAFAWLARAIGRDFVNPPEL